MGKHELREKILIIVSPFKLTSFEYFWRCVDKQIPDAKRWRIKLALKWLSRNKFIVITNDSIQVLKKANVYRSSCERKALIKEKRFTKRTTAFNMTISASAFILSWIIWCNSDLQDRKIHRLENQYEIMKDRNRQLKDQVQYMRKHKK